MTNFGFTFFITNIIVSLALWLTNVLIAHQSGGIGEVGLLNVANQWRVSLSFLPAVMIQALLPVLSGKIDPSGSTEFNKTLSLSVNLIILVLFPVCSFLMLGAPYIIQLFGPSYVHGEIALIGIFLSSFISGIVSLFGPVLQSREELLIAFLFNLLFGVLLISIILIFGNRYGAASYTFGSAAAYMVSTLLLFKFYIRLHMDKASRHRILLAIFNAVLIATLCIVYHFYPGMIFSAVIALTIFICTYALMDPYFLNLRKYLTTYK
jgi:O-antigen/teichoic acid export membrane protein